MPKKKVIIEVSINVTLVGPDLTKGYARVYRNYPVTIEYTNPKNIGGEAWEWAQSHWDEFTPDELKFKLGGAMVKGNRQWVCVIGVSNAKGKPLPFVETKWTSKKTKKKGSWDTGAKKKKKASPKPKTRKEKALDTAGVTDDDLDVGSTVVRKIKDALKE